MHYLLISFSHKNTDIKTREKLAFNSNEKLENFLNKLINYKSINEAIVLSTCNRVEIILSTKEVFNTTEFVITELSYYSKISKDELEGRADIFEDTGAIHHLFSVSSSLDSLVVGETQISGQLKDAFNFSYERKYCSQKLSRAMHYAFKCAASVRNSTDISKNPVSVASSAVAKAKDVLGGELGGYTGLVVGAGEMSQLTAKHLINSGCNVIFINRDLKKAQEIANELGSLVSVEPISKLKELINRYRLLFSATGAPHTVIYQDMVEEKSFKRHWFDIAVPMDIDDINGFDIDIYKVDDLQDIVNKNLALREEQARLAYSIVGRFSAEFFKWLQTLAVDPIIKELREQAKNSSQESLNKAIKKGYIDESQREAVTKILHSSFNKFLHSPTIKLKNISEEPIADSIVEAVKFIFDIDAEYKMLDSYKCEYAKGEKEN